MGARRVTVIGLDGVPLELVKPWAEQGHLPNMARLIHEGASGFLRSTIPPTSGPAWSSFSTGKNPGKTGIYDFLHRKPGTYNLSAVNTALCDAKSLWRILSDHGKKVGVVNVPISYPVEPVNGFLISGWLTPYTANDFTYPESLLHELHDKVGEYHIYPQETFTEPRRDAFFEASRHFLDTTLKANLYLMRREPLDFFMTVIFDTDRIEHQLWHYLDPTHPWRQRNADQDLSGYVLDYFKQVDRAIGEMVQEAGEDALTFIMSDHGMGAVHYFIILNIWLLQQGYLVLKNNAMTRLRRALFDRGFYLVNIHKIAHKLGLSKHAEYRGGYFTDQIMRQVFLSFLDVDWSKSKAYSYGRHFGNIFLNVKGREPQGIVEPGAEYESLRAEITQKALAFIHPFKNQPVVGRVLKREDVYHGPHAQEAPDLILIQKEGTDIFYGLSDFGINVNTVPVYRYSGMHRDDGMLVAHGKGIQPGIIQGAQIADLAPTILYAMSLPVPRDMDGKVLTDLFLPGDGRGQIEYTDDLATSEHSPEWTYTDEEDAQIKERLAGMGYLGT